MKKIIVLLFLGFISQLQAQKSFGFVFTNTPEKLFITKVFEIGPAQKAGVKVNDLWLKINNIVLLGKTNQEIGNILGQLQRDEASFEFSRNGKIVNLKFSRIERDLFLERCLSGDCTNGKGIYRFENGKTIEGEFKNGKYIDPYKPQTIVNKNSINNYLESLSIENIKTTETQPQFPTSHLQPNYIADQVNTSTLDRDDAVRSQTGYRDYLQLRFEAMILTLGLGPTKEVNLERAMALDNEAIRIFPNLSRAYIDRGQANYKLGNVIAAQNDFDKAKQLAPFYSNEIDKTKADMTKTNTNNSSTESTNYTPTNTYQPATEKTVCICSKCNGSGTFRVKSTEVYYPDVVNSNGQVVGKSSYSKTIDKYEDLTCTRCLGTGKCN